MLVLIDYFKIRPNLTQLFPQLILGVFFFFDKVLKIKKIKKFLSFDRCEKDSKITCTCQVNQCILKINKDKNKNLVGGIV